MKKVTILLLAAITGSLSIAAQSHRWCVPVSSSYLFSGPLKSIKVKMRKSELNKTLVYTEGFNLFG